MTSPIRSDGASDALATLSLAQGAYFAGTGLWALADLKSFQRVTGPKTDLWLVKTVGALVTVVGGVLAMAGLRRRISPEVGVLAAGSAVALAAIDVVYVGKGRIAPIYLADAAAETVLVAGWAYLWARRRPSTRDA